MSGHLFIRTGSVCRLVLGFVVFSISSTFAQEEADLKKRLEVMQAAVESLQPESTELKAKSALAVASKPLLRYSDPTRGGSNLTNTNVLLDAGIWRLGIEGRPTALVTVEIYGSPDRSRVLSYEFLSMTEKKFTLKHKTEKVHWEPSESGLVIKELPEAPKPAATAAARLAQMRQLMRRFVAKELFKKELIECRLLGQPIDRYQSEAETIVDGAIFAFANGTNPEIGIILESDGERWSYGILRLTSAEAGVTLDGREIVAYTKFDAGRRTDWPYHNDFYNLQMNK